MHTNILTFPTNRTSHRKSIANRVADNVVQLDLWRDRARVCRTQNGVFFTSNVLAFSGDAA